jgi:hypothetical protein
MLDCDVCMYACYLISAIVVTSFVLGEHTSADSFIPEQCSRYVIAWLSSPIRFFPLGA